MDTSHSYVKFHDKDDLIKAQATGMKGICADAAAGMGQSRGRKEPVLGERDGRGRIFLGKKKSRVEGRGRRIWKGKRGKNMEEGKERTNSGNGISC